MRVIDSYIYLRAPFFFIILHRRRFRFGNRRENAAAVHESRSAEQYFTSYESPTCTILYISLTPYVVQRSDFAVKFLPADCAIL